MDKPNNTCLGRLSISGETTSLLTDKQSMKTQLPIYLVSRLWNKNTQTPGLRLENADVLYLISLKTEYCELFVAHSK